MQAQYRKTGHTSGSVSSETAKATCFVVSPKLNSARVDVGSTSLVPVATWKSKTKSTQCNTVTELEVTTKVSGVNPIIKEHSKRSGGTFWDLGLPDTVVEKIHKSKVARENR